MLYHIISAILLWHNFLPSLIIQAFLDAADAQGPAYGMHLSGSFPMVAL